MTGQPEQQLSMKRKCLLVAKAHSRCCEALKSLLNSGRWTIGLFQFKFHRLLRGYSTFLIVKTLCGRFIKCLKCDCY